MEVLHETTADRGGARGAPRRPGARPPSRRAAPRCTSPTSAGPTSPPPRRSTGAVLEGARLRDRRQHPVGAGHLRRARRRATSTSSSATGCRRWRPTSRPTATTARSRWCAPTSRAPSTRWPCRTTAWPTPGSRTSPTSPSSSDQLDGTIYGIEPGNDGNRLILDMIDKDAFGLGKLRAEGELRAGHAGRRPSAREKSGKGDRVPRLGAAPDEHELQDDLPDRRRRLSSGRTSAAPRSTPTSRKGYAAECPNVGKLLAEPRRSPCRWRTRSWARSSTTARIRTRRRPAWLKANPDVLETWLAGVTTRDGGDGLAAVRAVARRLRPRRGGRAMDWITGTKIPVGDLGRATASTG